MLIDQMGKPKTTLKCGEHKSIQTDRVILVPGPPEEVQTVCWMYQQFTQEGKRESKIAELLNSRGIQTDLGRSWTRGTVREVLTNEKYIGNNVYNRTSFKLKKKNVRNSPELWVRKEGAFDPIVPADLFYTARGIFLERNRQFSDEEMLAGLRALLEKHSTLSASVIDAAKETPSSAAFRNRFGSLIQAYHLAGFVPDRDYSYIEINRHLRSLQPQYLEELVERLATAGASVSLDTNTGFLMINEEYSASVVLSRCRETVAGSLRWLIRIDQHVAPDITILVRMDPVNKNPTDYYLLPIMDLQSPRLLMCESHGAYLDTYQFESLDYFTTLASRHELEVAA